MATPIQYYEDEYILDPQLVGIIVLYLQFNELYNLYQASKQYSDVINTTEIINLLVGKWLPDHKVSLICNFTELFITYNIVNNGCLADLDVCLSFRDVYETTELALEECNIKVLSLLPEECIIFDTEAELSRALELNNTDLMKWIVDFVTTSKSVYDLYHTAANYFNQSDTRLYDYIFDTFGPRSSGMILNKVQVSSKTQKLYIEKMILSNLALTFESLGTNRCTLTRQLDFNNLIDKANSNVINRLDSIDTLD